MNKKRKLRRLAILTALMLAGIMLLQVYWLYTSYTQQRKRFTLDITNTISEVSLYESMVSITNQPSGNNGVTSFVINVHSSGKTQPKLPTVTISDEPSHDETKASKATTTFFVSKEAISGPTKITPQLIDSLLDSCKLKTKEELKKREIQVPFQMAIIDEKGAIVKATCDTATFHKIAVKSPIKPLVTDGAKTRLSMQAAFPDADLYLLRRMAMILSVTVLLIIIGAWSFSYMLIQFFRQKRMDDIRNDFMNNMTHELKTPISSALIAIEMAEGKKGAISDDTRLGYMDVAKSEIQRLTMLIDRVLKMAAFDHNEIAPVKTPISVSALVNKVIDNLRILSERAGAEVSLTTKSEALSVWGDKEQLTHALQNLLENAIKYNDKPTPRIHFDIKGDDAGVFITVTDNGKGIPSAFVTKVFDKFFRVPSGDIHDIKGYGLGLSYVKAIATLHGGTITVSSKEKEGSVFTLFLPNK